MNKDVRKKMVLAMEYICRQLNDENDLMSWLTVGVADGDIPEGSMDVDDVDEYYIEDRTFGELMTCFLRRMSSANKDGGLYCDGITNV